MSNPTWFSDRVLDRSMHLIRGSAGIVAVVSVEPEYGDKEADNIAATMAASADMVILLRDCIARLEGLDRRLLEITGGQKECELGEITRARALLAKLEG